MPNLLPKLSDVIRMKILFSLCAAGLLAIQASAAPTNVVEVTATNFVQKNIYHSPQTPGYTSWTALWRTPQEELRLAFQQVSRPSS